MNAGIDQNSKPTLTALSSADGVTIVGVYADPTTHRLLVDSAGSSGIVIGTTTITSGTTGRILFDNAGVVGEKAVTGSGNVVLVTSPTLVTPILGTPTSVTLTNATGLPISTGVSGLGSGVATFLATPSSANLATVVTDETGSGALVFANTPTLVTPVLGNATGTSVTLGTASTTTGTIVLKNSTNANTLTLQPGATGSNIALTLPTTVGSAGQFLQTNGAGVLSFASISATAGGSNTQIQYNNAGALAGISGVTSNGTSITAMGIALGSDATGDIYYRNVSGNLTRLAIGASTAVLHGGVTPSYSAVVLTTDVSGVLPVANGGTALATTPTNGQLLIGNGTNYTLAAITQTANQVLVTNGAGTITLSTPQSIATSSTPTFASMTLTAASSITLGTASTSAGAILFKNATNANVLTLQSGVSASSFALTLPTADGSSGQFLKTNGSGVLSFGSAMANPLTTTGDVIYSSDNSGTPARLAVGATGAVLNVSGGIPAWVGTGGFFSHMKFDGSLTFAAQTTLTYTLSQSYDIVIFFISSLTSSGQPTMQFNGDTAANYSYIFSTNAAISSSSGQTSFNLGGSTDISAAYYTIQAKRNGTGKLTISGNAASASSISAIILTRGIYTAAADLSTITVFGSSALTGKIDFYGLTL